MPLGLRPIILLRDVVQHRSSFFEEKVCHGTHIPIGWNEAQCEWFNDMMWWLESSYYKRTASVFQLRHALSGWWTQRQKAYVAPTHICYVGDGVEM